MTRCLAQPYISGNHGREKLTAKKALQILHYLIREVGPLVVHCEERALDFQVRVTHPADLANGFQKLGNSFQREILALNGNQNRVSRDKSVDRKDIQGWGAVDQNEIVAITNRRQNYFQSLITTFILSEFDGCADKFPACRRKKENIKFRGKNH